MSDSENILPWPPCSGSWQKVHTECSTIILYVAVGKTFTVTVPLSSYSWQLAEHSQWLFRFHPIHGSWQNIHSDCSAVILFMAVGKTFTVTVLLSSYLWQLAKHSQWLLHHHSPTNRLEICRPMETLLTKTIHTLALSCQQERLQWNRSLQCLCLTAMSIPSVCGGFSVPEASSEVFTARNEGWASWGVCQGSDWTVVALVQTGLKKKKNNSNNGQGNNKAIMIMNYTYYCSCKSVMTMNINAY